MRCAAMLLMACTVLLDAAPRATAAEAPFGFAHVVDQARTLAQRGFTPPPAVPEFWQKVGYDQHRDIDFDRNQALWRDGGNFRIELIHPGNVYKHTVKINTYDRAGVSPVPFSTSMFTYGRSGLQDKVPKDFGFAGFRITYPLYRSSEWNHVLVFAGASYFRPVGKNQVFGLSGRGLAIDTGLPSGEEFPSFTEFWLERPPRDATSVTVLALLDSPRVTGAYQFVLRVTPKTVIDVKATLFERKRVTELGIAPLTSMFFYGEERGRPSGHWRPEVHDSDGLLVNSANGEWLWRPLVNPDRLLMNYFQVDGLRGFGLLQRDRSFSAYEDLGAHYELRPSAWITPIGDWGKGQVKLVQIPTQNEYNDNIVAYWLPAALPPAGQPIELAYRISVQSDDPLPAGRGRTTATRIGDGDAAGVRRVVLDFEGGALRQLGAGADVKPVVWTASEGELVQQNAFKNPVTGGWRLAFQLKQQKGKAVELRASLQHKGETITETWSYLLLP
ncbi:MAG TPA: glucan biosynthesis protein [Methylomirabilota bacterium]|nr:glucan biosynthesis protein [Methylomirabilota bacterium]